MLCKSILTRENVECGSLLVNTHSNLLNVFIDRSQKVSSFSLEKKKEIKVIRIYK